MTHQVVETGQPAKRPLRADAAQNRAKLLKVAYETFAELGVNAPVDEIVRRAGVGAGTFYRHFPTKEQLFLAVITERIAQIFARGEELLRTAPPSEAFFVFFSETINCGGTDQGLADALERSGVDLEKIEPRFEEIIYALFEGAQQAGTLRHDLEPEDVRFFMKGCFSAQRYLEDESRGPFLVSVVLDGMRARST
jgi:AcrR family transcriptional regulator